MAPCLELEAGGCRLQMQMQRHKPRACTGHAQARTGTHRAKGTRSSTRYRGRGYLAWPGLTAARCPLASHEGQQPRQSEQAYGSPYHVHDANPAICLCRIANTPSSVKTRTLDSLDSPPSVFGLLVSRKTACTGTFRPTTHEGLTDLPALEPDLRLRHTHIHCTLFHLALHAPSERHSTTSGVPAAN